MGFQLGFIQNHLKVLYSDKTVLKNCLEKDTGRHFTQTHTLIHNDEIMEGYIGRSNKI